jgi:hypothetical protein
MNMSTHRALCAAALALALGVAGAARAGGAEQTLADASGGCHAAIPSNWTVKPGRATMASSPDGLLKLTLTRMPEAAHMNYDNQRSVARKAWQGQPGFQVVEEGAARTIYRLNDASAVHWSVFMAGPPVCHAMLTAPQADNAQAAGILAALR